VHIDDTARIEDCVKRSPCVYRVDITDNPPLIVALASVERLVVRSWPLMNVDAPTAKLPVVEILLPTKRGPAVEMVEFVVKTPLMLMFVVLMKGAKIVDEALIMVVLTRGVKIVEVALTKVVLIVLPT
jgi:hypothetical protein